MIPDHEITRVADNLSRASGQKLRQMMLEVGMTEEEILKVVEDIRHNTYINGVPMDAEMCQHCKGRGWTRP